MPDLSLTSHALAAIFEAARDASPHEACGLLLGREMHVEEARPAANVAPDPARHFEIDPAALIAAHRAARDGGPDIIGYYHSHPTGPARPSPTDVAEAAGDGMVWAIVGSDGAIGWFRSLPSGFESVTHTVLP